MGDITVNHGVLVNFTAGGTLGTGGNVRKLNVGTGAILNLSSQASSTAPATGFIKKGNGILFSSNGNTSNGATINTSGFDNPLAGNIGVSLGGAGLVPGDNSQIYLTDTAEPEPDGALLGGLGLLALLRRRR
jgi:MYXO-CTERM domain-containing protein